MYPTGQMSQDSRQEHLFYGIPVVKVLIKRIYGCTSISSASFVGNEIKIIWQRVRDQCWQSFMGNVCAAFFFQFQCERLILSDDKRDPRFPITKSLTLCCAWLRGLSRARMECDGWKPSAPWLHESDRVLSARTMGPEALEWLLPFRVNARENFQ